VSVHRGLEVRIKSSRIVRLEEPVPVYDVSVKGTENFKLADGPFVHNSKDVADALSGVVYGLTMRREIWAQYGVPLGSIPASVATSLKKEPVKTEEGGGGRAT